MASKAEIMAKAHARHMFAYELRNQGLKFKEIGEKMNISASRARALYLLTKRMMNRRLQSNGN